MRLLALSILAAFACGNQGAGVAPVGIVSLHDVTTESIVALGGGDRLVGVAEPVDVEDGVREALAGVSRVSGVESIVAAGPAIVVGTDVIAQRDPDLVRALRGRGMDVRLYALRTLDDTWAMLGDLDGALGTEAAPPLIARLRGRAKVASVVAERPVRVFVYDCCDPPFTAGGAAPLSELLSRAGAVNVFADLDRPWGSVSWEEAIARAPELVVIDAYAFDGQGDVAAKRARLARLPALGALPVAVVPLRQALGGIGGVDGLETLRAAVAKVAR